jgi:UDP-N-acetylmuramyl pentapeptide phosphotransferase/UDP-N-acetylglucosamine-1-phosphate transferase
MLLIALAVGLAASLVACGLALGLFPWFRSGERKPGDFRPDESTGGHHAIIVTRGRSKRVRAVRSSELPLVGGTAMLLAIIAATIAAAVTLNFTGDQWQLLGILLAAGVGYAAVGFLDDWRKVHQGQGVSEITKFIGVFIVSLAAAIALNRLVPSARFVYPPYTDVPLLGNVLRHTHFAWIAFFVAMTVTVASTTSLAADFSDGFDGLAGGLFVSAGLSFAIIIFSQHSEANWPSVVLLLALVGAVLGYLPFNWPSGYKAHGQGRGPRRARLIMGDTGSLALGGILALVAVVTRLELLLPFIGGIFVLEGVSALISARILVKFFRRFLSVPRFGGERGFAHTEFPLPFLATPMHHHFDLLGWDRRRIVYGAWALGALLAILGVASAIAPFTWERYLARFLSLCLILFIWQTGPWTRSFFIGLVRSRRATLDAPMRLGLFYGFPYRLFGFRLFGRVDVVNTTETVLKTPAERLSLWQRMSVFDARATLGYYCYRAGDFQDAVRVWQRIPKRNLEVRPEITALLRDAQPRAALQADGELDLPFSRPSAVGSGASAAAPSSFTPEVLLGAPVGFSPSVPLSTPLSLTLNGPGPVSAPPYFEPPFMLTGSPGANVPAYVEPPAAPPDASVPEPSVSATPEPGLSESLPVVLPPEVTGTVAETPLPLWSASNWATARGTDDVPTVEE